MRLISADELAKEWAAHAKLICDRSNTGHSPGMQRMSECRSAKELNAVAEELGWLMWTVRLECSVCRESVGEVVRMKEEDPDSGICCNCLLKAMMLIEP